MWKIHYLSICRDGWVTTRCSRTNKRIHVTEQSWEPADKNKQGRTIDQTIQHHNRSQKVASPSKVPPHWHDQVAKKGWLDSEKIAQKSCKVFGKSCKLFFFSTEREHAPHHWFSPFMWGSQKGKDIEFFLSSTHLHSCCLQIRDHNQMSQILAAYGERASSEVAKRLRAWTVPPGYD